MSYFSRLTDIVTCNLSDILAGEADPPEAILQIIREMEEGLSGATRSIATANDSVERQQREIDEHAAQVEHWTNAAKDQLRGGHEDEARLSLLRKRQVEDVIAGVQQQLKAAIATRDHLTTTLRALEARLAEAHRKRQGLDSGNDPQPATSGQDSYSTAGPSLDEARSKEIDNELEALKRELGK